MTTKPMTYAGTGVDYSAMDPHKVDSQQAGRQTDKNVERLGFEVLEWSRGESCIITRTPPLGYVAFVVEGLGTKSLVADGLCDAYTLIGADVPGGRSFYDNLAQCNAAMALNDLSTSGARAVVYGQYLALGNSKWLDQRHRSSDLVRGTKQACDLARCAWGCGETPTNIGVIVPGVVDLAGAAWGVIKDESQLINPANIEHGDAIVIIESTGPHANGYTLMRRIGAKLPEGYLTGLSDGRTYGEALLDPTHIYAGLVEDCQDAGVRIHYAVNITGHGWRKFMRAPQPWTYVLTRVPPPGPIFDFIQEHGPVDDREAYGNLNMRVGFALYVRPADASKVVEIAAGLGFTAYNAGHIEAGKRQVIIEPKNIVFEAEELQVR